MCVCLFVAGMYMGAPQMGYAPAPSYGHYQALAAQQGMMGAMMAPQVNMLGQPGVMATARVATPSPYMAGVQGGMMGVQGGMMGGVGALPQQQAYTMQQSQQLQWNITQVQSYLLKSVYVMDTQCRNLTLFHRALKNIIF